MNTPDAITVPIATTDSIAGESISQTLGVVVGIALHSRGVGGNIIAGLDGLGNGSALDEYRDLLTSIRQEALARMREEAVAIGATALVGIRFDSAEIGREMVEVVAYGTAVLLQRS